MLPYQIEDVKVVVLINHHLFLAPSLNLRAIYLHIHSWKFAIPFLFLAGLADSDFLMFSDRISKVDYEKEEERNYYR
ncbi:MAG: hypothetical protein DRH10_04645, partial [Deltaproteobacteria bacterium]